LIDLDAKKFQSRGQVTETTIKKSSAKLGLENIIQINHIKCEQASGARIRCSGRHSYWDFPGKSVLEENTRPNMLLFLTESHEKSTKSFYSEFESNKIK